MTNFKDKAYETAKETYFDLTTHPSEVGPKGTALLDEYLTCLEPRLEQALEDAYQEGWSDGRRELKDII